MRSPQCGWLAGDVIAGCWPGSRSPDICAAHAHTHTLLVNRVCQIPHTPKGLIGFLFKWKPRDYLLALGSRPGLPPHLHPSPSFLNKRGFKIAAGYVNNSRSREDALQVGGAWFLGPWPPAGDGPGPRTGPCSLLGFFFASGWRSQLSG